MAQDAEAVVRAVYTALNAGDAAVFELLDLDVEWVTPASLPWTVPGSDGAYRGHRELGAYFARCLSEVSDLQLEVLQLLPAGERVLALVFECGRSRATGRAFRARAAQLWTVRDGRVARLDGFPDTAHLAAAFQPPARQARE